MQRRRTLVVVEPEKDAPILMRAYIGVVTHPTCRVLILVFFIILGVFSALVSTRLKVEINLDVLLNEDSLSFKYLEFTNLFPGREMNPVQIYV